MPAGGGDSKRKRQGRKSMRGTRHNLTSPYKLRTPTHLFIQISNITPKGQWGLLFDKFHHHSLCSSMSPRILIRNTLYFNLLPNTATNYPKGEEPLLRLLESLAVLKCIGVLRHTVVKPHNEEIYLVLKE